MIPMPAEKELVAITQKSFLEDYCAFASKRNLQALLFDAISNFLERI